MYPVIILVLILNVALVNQGQKHTHGANDCGGVFEVVEEAGLVRIQPLEGKLLPYEDQYQQRALDFYVLVELDKHEREQTLLEHFD